jgi:hypothetical protein
MYKVRQFNGPNEPTQPQQGNMSVKHGKRNERCVNGQWFT